MATQLVLNNMRRNCKCHGVSGTCTATTCWHQLPNFREVANQLHEKFDQAIQLQSFYLSTNSPSAGAGKLLAGLYPPLEMSVGVGGSLQQSYGDKKWNKKRSSSPSVYPTPARFAARSAENSNQDQRNPSNATSSISGTTQLEPAQLAKRHAQGGQNQLDNQAYIESPPSYNQSKQNEHQSVTTTTTHYYANNRTSTTTTVQIRRPVARSIAMETQRNLHKAVPSKLDLVYQLQSPDFCNGSETYMIKGTKGRFCSENANAPDRCDKLCCGRGYKTEVREEKYNCECIFKYCCELDCKTCTRRKVIHKCL